MATDMLNSRLAAIKAQRQADPTIVDPTPTLLDIERTHVLFTNAHFKPFVAIGYEYNKVNTTSGTVTLGSDVQFSIPQFGDFFNDMVLYVQLAPPTVTTAGSGNAPTVRWCEYPGIRLLSKVSFDVNGNPLDSYTRDAALMHSKVLVPPNKRAGWDRCMGQQSLRKGYMNPGTATQPDNHRTWVQVSDGYQTPKAACDTLSMFIPLLFWCNLDPRLAVPSVAIPYGQRFITVSLAPGSDLVNYQDRSSGAVTTTLSTPVINSMSLYINNIFVNPEIHAIFIARIGFTLIRVHRQQNITFNTTNAETLLQNLKWPIETIYLGMRLTSLKSDIDKWDKFTNVTDTTFTMPNLVTSASTFAGQTATIASTGSQYAVTVTPTFAQANCTAPVVAPLIDNITISAHGIYLYNNLPADFFNSYIPTIYGGYNITTPEDTGVFMIPFNLYPGSYQPSGHVNVSRAREFYFSFTSSYIGTIVNSATVTGEAVLVASAINFLLISDGSAVLRYST